MKQKSVSRVQSGFEYLLFWSRWLQAPLYLGLIVAQGVFAYKFFLEIIHLLTEVNNMSEGDIMLLVLGLVDIVMVANLLLMVTIGGYQTFVSRLDFLENEQDQPEWLSHVNAGVLKIKLGTAIVGISSIHLLRTFINIDQHDTKSVMWQTIIHMVFLFSAVFLAYTDNLMNKGLMMVKKAHLDEKS